MKTLEAAVHGRVQGVGFRYFVQDMARELGLVGWVRNAPDGTVQLEAQGADEALERLKSALSDGPRLAHVSRVDVCWTERPAYDGFDLRW